MFSKLYVFGFDEIWDVSIMIMTLLLAVGYLCVTGPFRKFVADAESVPLYKKVLFLLGLTVFYVVEGPLDLLGHLSFSAHMIKQALLYLVMPPLLYLGAPIWFYRPFLRVRLLKNAIRFMTKPLLTVVLFNGLFSLYHMPVVFDTVMTHYGYYNLYHTVLLVTALIMWWPFFCPVKQLNDVSPLKRLALLFANSFLLTPACALIIFAGEPMYRTFTDPAMWGQALSLCLPFGSTFDAGSFSGPQFFFSVHPLHDQQLGGVFMKLVQEIVNGITLVYILLQWMKLEKAKEKLESELDVFIGTDRQFQTVHESVRG